MFNLSRYASLSYVVRNFGVTKKLFASTSVLAEKQDPVDTPKDFSKEAKKVKSPIIAAVFASLGNENDKVEDIVADSSRQAAKKVVNAKIDETIMKAKTVNGLLSISENQPELSRKHALKIVSILAEWSTINKIKLNEFENDARFTKLCRMLGRTSNIKSGNGSANQPRGEKPSDFNKFQAEDLNMILGVTGDDEAAKLIETITLPQMVKVLKNLSLRKRRSTPLLRSLAFNMSNKEHKIDISNCVDVLYSMATLNFPEPVLLAKICESIQEALKEPIKKSSLAGSCITSLALMRYRDPLVLDALTEWICNNQDICRTQDTSAVFMSLASLNHLPSDYEDVLKNKLATSLTPLDFKRSIDYLGFVWSLMMLNFTNQDAYNTVLGQEFIDKLVSESRDTQLTPTAKMKLLNINAAVKLFLPTYSGAMLDRELHKTIYDVPLAHNRGKQLIVNGMIDAIKSVVPENCLKLNNDTSMGFVTDAEFYVDDKGNPVAKETNGGKKVALMVHDFHDMCQGTHQTLNGIAALNLRLLTKAGYHAISVPFNEFSISDKLLKRVQYLDDIVKRLTKTNST